MKKEVQSAVDFLTNILCQGNVNGNLISLFKSELTNLLSTRYQDHWFPEKPFKGSGYRCIRFNHNIDPVIKQAGNMCGLEASFLVAVFPAELTIWVDPRDVSFRIGENGSVGMLYDCQESTTIEKQPIPEQAPTNRNSSMNRCKEQFLSMSSEAVHYGQLTGFVSSLSAI